MESYEGAEVPGLDPGIERAWRDGLKPDPLLTVSGWADRYRALSQRASSEPGRWRTERTPYLKEIMDCLSPASPVQRVALMKGAQIGGTECGNCWIGYVIHQAPGPMMAVAPTVELAKRNSKQRIDPLIEESEVLRERVKERRSRDSGNTVLSKEFPGGVLILTDFYGLQAMAARAMFEAGECFFRFRPRRPDDGLSVPLQLQMLSAEHLPLSKCETLPNGHEIVFGIELDRIGRRAAYHFHRTHPGDVRQSGAGELVRVPADQVCHVFHPIAEGQIRGVPWVAPAMVRLWLLDQYDDAGRRSRRCSRASLPGPGACRRCQRSSCMPA